MSVEINTPSNSTVIIVGVRELKDHLSSYLRQVKDGKIVEITEHGKPVGRIIPQEKTLDERLEAMRQAGLVRWNGKKFRSGEPVGETIGEKQLSDIVSELRE